MNKIKPIDPAWLNTEHKRKQAEYYTKNKRQITTKITEQEKRVFADELLEKFKEKK